MQQAIGIKRYVVNHLGATALAVGILVSGAIGVAGLATSGGLPVVGGESEIAAPSTSSGGQQMDRAAYIAQLRGDTAAMRDEPLARQENPRSIIGLVNRSPLAASGLDRADAIAAIHATAAGTGGVLDPE